MTTLPALPDTNSLQQKHSAAIGSFTARADKLAERAAKFALRPEPWPPLLEAHYEQLAREAKQLDDQALIWLRAWEAETKPLTQAAYRSWKTLTDFVAKVAGTTDPKNPTGPSLARKKARKIITDFNDREERKAAAQRRKNEADKLAMLQQEKQAEADHLRTMADETGDESYAEEAAVLEAAPVSVPVSEAPAVTKIEGASSGTKLVGAVTDDFLFHCWLLKVDPANASRDRFEVVHPQISRPYLQSQIDALLKRMACTPDEWSQRGVTVETESTYANQRRTND